MILFLLACGKSTTGEGTVEAATLEDYVGAENSYLQFTPLDQPEGPLRLLRITAEKWELRSGAEWEEAGEGNRWSIETKDGAFWVGQDLLLPGINQGDAAEDAVVTGTGPFSTWYGTFPDTVQVEISGGGWTGQIVFARDVGPIRFGRGDDWDLVYYERDWEPRRYEDSGGGGDSGGDSGADSGQDSGADSG
ncbi:MAG TPA: hypothetical protein PKA50_10985 [Gemmatimonadales bacterium]|nr:hypothetical protein [Gemmatimonadales bacterium]